MDDPVVEALDAQQRELAQLVDDLDADGLMSPTRCEGWSVSDVLLHLAQTNEVAVASVTGNFGEVAGALVPERSSIVDVDDWAAAAVAGEPETDPEQIRDRWRRSAEAQVAAFRACEASARVPWVAGELAARTLATTRLAETWIHSGDVASAIGVDLAPTDRLWHIVRLAHRTLPYAFARAGRDDPGPVRFTLEAPDGSVWTFGDDNAPTVVSGSALGLCQVAGRRTRADEAGLSATGPSGPAVLELVRTFA